MASDEAVECTPRAVRSKVVLERTKEWKEAELNLDSTWELTHV